jgi:hypothetical protein
MATAIKGTSLGSLKIFTKETLVKGQPTQLECVEIAGQSYAVNRGAVTILSLEEEWYDDVRDPDAVIDLLKNSEGFKPDIFTFWQRLPDLEPKFSYHVEWEEIAVLPIQTFDHWWNTQIKGTTRNMVRKSQKAGVVVKESLYTDEFVKGMTDIFNESPIRQGRRFWHYGKSVEVVRKQFSRFLFREKLIGAYYQDELIGFAMLGNAGRFGDLGQIISKTKHRDKAVTNALIAKAVELCEAARLPHLVYAYWNETSLADFKRHSGFEKVCLPRYFVPLTARGKMAMKTGVHRGIKTLLPTRAVTSLKSIRSWWLRKR